MPDSWDFTAAAPPKSRAAEIPIITYLLIFLCVLFTAAYLTGGSSTFAPWHRLYLVAAGSTAENVWDGHVWVMLTAMLVHGSIPHILFNMLWLYQLGTLMEKSLHPVAYVGLILTAGIVGGGSEIIWGNDLGIGFSGVVYAMFGLAWMGRHRHREWQVIANDQNMLIMVVWAFGCWIATALHFVGVANGAHFGGFAFGLSVGWLAYGNRLRLLAIVPIGLLVALTVISLVWMPWSGPWNFIKGGQQFDKGNYINAIVFYKRSLKHGFEPEVNWHNIAAAWQNLALETYEEKDFKDSKTYYKNWSYASDQEARAHT